MQLLEIWCKVSCKSLHLCFSVSLQKHLWRTKRRISVPVGARHLGVTVHFQSDVISYFPIPPTIPSLSAVVLLLTFLFAIANRFRLLLDTQFYPTCSFIADEFCMSRRTISCRNGSFYGFLLKPLDGNW